MEASDVDDVVEIIKMFLSSACLQIEDAEVQSQLAMDWLEALEAGTALRKKMIRVVSAQAGKMNNNNNNISSRTSHIY